MMAKVAKVRAAIGRPEEAVEILATVLAQPMSAQQPFADNTPIKDSATRVLDDLRQTLGNEECSAALARGTSTPFEVAAKKLMAGLVDVKRDRVHIGS
jgi:hypothetical protein